MNASSPHSKQSKRPNLRNDRGFALIVTISMMILLALLAVGLLSLSTVALRSSTTSSSIETARANARMALMLAIGELQKHAGPDQRVTASGTLTGADAKHPNWAGVWSTKDKETLPAWLVSGNEAVNIPDLDELNAHPTDYRLPGTDLSGEKIEIFKGNDPKDTVEVPLVEVDEDNDKKGRYGWWVSDEGVKARVDLELAETNPSSDQERLTRALVSQEPNLAEINAELEPLSDPDSDLDKSKLVSFRSIDLALGTTGGDPSISRNYAHQLTTGGYGLPVNVAEGGMKTDLSLVFDSSQFRNNRMLQSVIGATPREKTLSRNGPSIYTFEQVSDPQTFYLSPELSSERNLEVGPNWGILYNYAKLWDHVDNGQAAPFSFNPPLFSDMWTNDWAPYNNHNLSTYQNDEQHTNSSLEPLLYSMQMGFRFTSRPAMIPKADGSPSGVMGHQLQIQMKPLLGFWNPYNVKIKARYKQVQWALYPHIRLNIDHLRPPFIPDTFHSKPRRIRTDIWMREFWKQGGGLVGQGGGGRRMLLQTDPIDFEPGEIRLFSISGRAEMEQTNKLVPDFDDDGGFIMDLTYSAASKGDGTYDQDTPMKPIIVPDGSEVFYGALWLEDTVKEQTAAAFGNEIVQGVTSSYITVGGGAANISHRVTDIWQPMKQTGRTGGAVQNGNTWVVPEPVISPWTKTGGASTAPKIPIGIIAKTPTHIGTWRFFTRTATEAMPAETAAGSQRIRSWIDSNPRFGPMNPRWDGSTTDNNESQGLHFISPFIGGSYSPDPWDGGPRGRGLVAEGQDEFGAAPEVDNSGGRYRGFGGLSTAQNGQSHVPMFDVPRAPLVSLGQFQHAQLSRYGYEPALPFGNSQASIRIPLDRTFTDNFNDIDGMRMLDLSHSLNSRLWDECFFSTIGVDYRGGGSLDDLFPSDELASGKVTLPNPRNIYIPINGNESISDIASRNDQSGPKAISSRIGIKGAFNVNSASKEAWKALLASMENFEFPVIDPTTAATSWSKGNGIRFPRFGHVMQEEGWSNGDSASDAAYWSGFREISEDELDELAENIVEQIRERGPFRSFADFVNRDPESSTITHQRKGALQTALDRSLNSKDVGNVGDALEVPSGDAFFDAFDETEHTAAGYAGYMMQSDLLQAMAPVIQVRSDYFRIRAVGQAMDAAGNVTASATCEAFVQRGSGFVDSSDEPHLAVDLLSSTVNKAFGRRFNIVSFRWLDAGEV